MLSDSERAEIQYALEELRLTTAGWRKPNGSPNYPSGVAPASSHWGKAMPVLERLAAPAPPPDPDPDPAPGDVPLGLNTNANFPTYQNGSAKALPLAPKCIRTDARFDAAFLDWAQAHGARPLLVTVGADQATTLALLRSNPRFRQVELDNEPYFSGVDLPAWARQMRDTAKAVKAQLPGVAVLVPLLVQTNGGDYLVGGAWKPWVNVVLDAAPDLPAYVDGWAIHPYPDPADAPPQWGTVDKVAAQLRARNAMRSFHVTEFGWSVGTGTTNNREQTSAQEQADYLRQFVTQARARSDIAALYYYCLHSWSDPFFGSFGLYGPDGAKRPAADVFAALA